ncbi:MAG: thioredoxin domain-containing protein [Patescibacteria group bacterium]|nr:thioredoxin domain-containing protein [Patescibacteria group bacterium]MDE2438336.1 thioredoxin domain-containing protein [Patescibacteria group bacterium]
MELTQGDNSSKKENKYEAKQEERKRTAAALQKKKTLKRVSFWTFVILLLGGGVYGIIKLGDASPSSQAAFLVAPVSSQDLVMGSSTSRVVLIEYSDFQCPACGAYYPLVKQITSEYQGRIQFVYRNFPLPQHKNAKLAIAAAYAADKQGRFWEMHDALFEHQPSWAESNNAEALFITYAGDLHLNVTQFTSDLHSPEIQQRVDSDYEQAVKAGINSTPSFFLDGARIQPQNYDAFKSAIDKELAAHA